MFHVELRHFPHKAWRFNLSEAELRAVAVPWAREEWLEFAERKWNPHEAKITILEGPQLEVQEIAMNRGWANAKRRSEDITERVLATIRRADEERARAEDNARIEEAVRARTGGGQGPAGPQAEAGAPVAREASAEEGAPPAQGSAVEAAAGQGARAPAASVPVPDPLALGVQLASLLGSQPSRLLAAWQAAAAASPGAPPSETLAMAERTLESGEGSSG